MSSRNSSKRTADGTFKWQCKTLGCTKQAQSRCESHCKRCYRKFRRINTAQGAVNVPVLDNRGSVDKPCQINTTQGAHNVEICSDRGSDNNAAVSHNPCRINTTQGAHNVAIFDDRSSDQNAAVSHQVGATSFDRYLSVPSMEYVASLEKRIDEMNIRIVHLETLIRDNLIGGTQTNVATGFGTFSCSSQSTTSGTHRNTSPILETNQFNYITDAVLNNFTSVQGDATTIPTGFSFFSAASQPDSDNQPLNRTSRTNSTTRTHQDMIARCVRNESDELANAGLSNNGVICYANAVFQALANFNHLTTLFNDPPPENKDVAFPLNHAFCTVLHSLVKRPRNPDFEVNPSNFIDLFTDIHQDFAEVESKFCHPILFFHPSINSLYTQDINDLTFMLPDANFTDITYYT